MLPSNIGIAVILTLCLCGGGGLFGGSIYSIGVGPQSPFTLYQLSPTTGAGTVVGPICCGYIGIDAMDASPNGTLFAFGSNLFATPSLLTINPATGAATLVGTMNLPIGTGAADFAFRSDGTLFAILGSGGGEGLYTVNTSTAAATLIGSLAFGSDTLAFGNNGTLYMSNGVDLYSVNQATAALTLVTALSFDSGFGLTGSPGSMWMKFDPQTGTLYTTVGSPGGPDITPTFSLGTINLATGEVSRIGATIEGGPLAIVTPEASSVLLTSTGLSALLLLRRRRRV